MALQETGPISLLDVREEFGNIIDGGDFLSEYWGVAATIPKRGQEISLSDFYGAVNLQMTVTVSNTDPTLELVASDSGRAYVAALPVLLTTSTASEFSYTQSGSSRGYNTWYKNLGTGSQSGPYYQIGSEIQYSDAGTTVADPQYMTASNAAAYGYTNAGEPAVDGHVKYTNTNNAYPQETWVSQTSPYEMKTREVGTEDYGVSGVVVTTANAGTSDYWYPTSGIKYVFDETTIDRNGYYRWYISGTNNTYWSLGTDEASPAVVLKEREGTVSTVDVTVSEAPYMGYTISSPAVTEDGHTRWTKGGGEYWARATDNKFYTRSTVNRNYTDQYDSNNYWKIEQGTNPAWSQTIKIEGNVPQITQSSTKPSATTATINGISVTRGSIKSGGLNWEEKYDGFDPNDGTAAQGNIYIYWGVASTGLSILDYETFPYGSSFYNETDSTGTKWRLFLTAQDLTQGNYNVQSYVGNSWTSGSYDFDSVTEITFNYNGTTYVYKRGPTQHYNRYNNSSSYFYRYSLNVPYNEYPEIYGITGSWTEYNYSEFPVSDSLVTYTYSPGTGITDSQRDSRTVYTYSEQLQLTKNVTTYQYSSIYEIRPEVLGISSTPQFTYDDARQALYRASSTSVSYPTKLSWPTSIAYSYNWKNQRTINNYYLTRMEVEGSSILEGGQETLVVSGTLINTGNNTPQRLVFSPNAEAAPEELTDYFFTLYRNDQGSSSPVNLGYVAPMNGGYPTMTLSSNSLTLGNLAANETFRLKWYGIQGAKLSASGGTATVDGVTNPFTSTGIPSLTISGGDNNRRGFDLYLERKVNTSPDAWAVIRSWEFFQDTNKSNLFGSNNYQIAGCDFLDIYKYGRN